MQVDAAAVQGWVSTVAKQLSAAPAPGAANTHASTLEALVLPADLDARLGAARTQLAASGRALVLSTDLIHTHASTPTPGSTTSTSSTAGGAAGGASGVAEATAAWLRTVGTPLSAGLLDGGYSFRQLRGLAPELKEALLLRLLDGGRPGGGAAAVAAAWYGGAAAAWEAARADAGGAAEAVAQLRREQVEAELDYVRERWGLLWCSMGEWSCVVLPGADILGGGRWVEKGAGGGGAGPRAGKAGLSHYVTTHSQFPGVLTFGGAGGIEHEYVRES